MPSRHYRSSESSVDAPVHNRKDGIFQAVNKYGALEDRRPLLKSTQSIPESMCSEGSQALSTSSRRRRKLTRQASVMVTPPFVLPSAVERTESAALEVEEELGLVSKLPPLTSRQKITVCMLALADFCSTTVFSAIAPFFPTIVLAAEKGASATLIGLIFGTFELFMFILAPIVGRTISTVGSKFMYTAGLFITGVTSILFGLLDKAAPGTTFIVLCFVVRFFEAVGDAMFLTASFTITAHEFPGRVSTIIGALGTFSGLGFTMGPLIGGVLFEAGGFILPFMVLGCFLLVAAVISIFLIPSRNDLPDQKNSSYIGLLKIPNFLVCILVITVAAISLSFLDPTLEPHLRSINGNLSALLIGLFFLIQAGVYALLSPFWGWLVDKKGHGRIYMMIGCTVSTVSFLLMGPSPIFHLPKVLWLVGVSLLINGFAIGAELIPVFQECMTLATENGYADSFETHGLISGIFQSAMSLGGFLGPTVFGGVVADQLGFELTTTIVALMHLSSFLIMLGFFCLRRRQKQ